MCTIFAATFYGVHLMTFHWLCNDDLNFALFSFAISNGFGFIVTLLNHLLWNIELVYDISLCDGISIFLLANIDTGFQLHSARKCRYNLWSVVYVSYGLHQPVIWNYLLKKMNVWCSLRSIKFTLLFHLLVSCFSV